MRAMTQVLACAAAWTLAACSGGGNSEDKSAARRPAAVPSFAGLNTQDESGMGGGPTDSAGGVSDAAAYEESCVESSSDDFIERTCTIDGTVCVERFTLEGEFVSWDCGAAGRYECVAGESAGQHLCTSTVGDDVCEEVFDADWNLVDSTCRDDSAPPATCETREDGTVVCTEGEECQYDYDATGVLVAVRCDYGVDFGVACAGDAEKLVCSYAGEGFVSCEETYTQDGTFGMLASSCDWDGDGQVDCQHSASSDANKLVCTYVAPDEYTCSVMYEADGSLAGQFCSMADGSTYDCRHEADLFVCTYTFGEPAESCVDTYDADLNFLSSTCADFAEESDSPSR